MGILTASARATQIRRKEIMKLRRTAERGIKLAEGQLKECSPDREEECRKILSDRMKTFSDYNEEATNNRTYLTEAKWFKDGERSSKRWVGLNKIRTGSTTIKSLFKENKNEGTTSPLKCLK